MDPIAHGYDWAWAQIPSSAVTSNGGSFVFRYLGGSARLTPQERDNHFAAGVKILLVFEQEATLAEGGFARGVAAAIQANDEADALGYPENCTIFYADDNNDPDAAQEVEFMRGVESVGRRPSDMYSGGNVLVALSALGLSEHGGWMVETWYPHDGADPCMIQLANTREPAMVGIPADSYDTNLLYKPIPMWSGSGTTSGDDDMTPDESKALFQVRNALLGDGAGGAFGEPVSGSVRQRVNETYAAVVGAPAVGVVPLANKLSTWLGQLQDHIDAQFAAAPAGDSSGGAKLADIQKAVHTELAKLQIEVSS